MAECFSCGAELEYVFKQKSYPEIPDALFDPYTGNRLNSSIMFKDALVIDLIGGYGMYFDDMADRHRVILCKSCADELKEQHPWLEHLFQSVWNSTNDTVRPYYEVKENSF